MCALRCPSCGAENEAATTCCTMCGVVLPKAAPAQAPAFVRSDAPLKTGADIAALLVSALRLAQTRDYAGAEKLMARLYLEVDGDLAGSVLLACGAEWLKSAKLSDADRRTANALLTLIAASVERRDLSPVVEGAVALIALVKEPSAEGIRLQLLLLGLKGAVAERKNRPA